MVGLTNQARPWKNRAEAVVAEGGVEESTAKDREAWGWGVLLKDWQLEKL